MRRLPDTAGARPTIAGTCDQIRAEPVVGPGIGVAVGVVVLQIDARAGQGDVALEDVVAGILYNLNPDCILVGRVVLDRVSTRLSEPVDPDLDPDEVAI